MEEPTHHQRVVSHLHKAVTALGNQSRAVAESSGKYLERMAQVGETTPPVSEGDGADN